MENLVVEFIRASRGIRQGDPISPFIFVLAMDYLHRLLTDMKQMGKIRGVNMEHNFNLSHVLFAE